MIRYWFISFIHSNTCSTQVVVHSWRLQPTWITHTSSFQAVVSRFSLIFVDTLKVSNVIITIIWQSSGIGLSKTAYWNPTRTIRSFLEGFYQFLVVDVDRESHGKLPVTKEQVTTALNQSKSFQCSRCGHTYDHPNPPCPSVRSIQSCSEFYRFVDFCTRLWTIQWRKGWKRWSDDWRTSCGCWSQLFDHKKNIPRDVHRYFFSIYWFVRFWNRSPASQEWSADHDRFVSDIVWVVP